MIRRALAWMMIAAWSATPALAVEQGDAAPAFSGADFQGRAIEFPEVAEGRPAVLIFWATWCPYCRAFMPYLQDIQADYAEDGVEIVAINAKERGRGDPQAYVASLGFPVIAVREGDAIAEAYGIEYIPGLLIVDGAGRVAYRRPWTELPAGRTVAELWDEQVRGALDRIVR